MNEIACLSELRVPQSRMEEISAFDGGRWELSTLPRPHPSCQNKPVKMADCFAERACRRTEVKSLNCHFNLLKRNAEPNHSVIPVLLRFNEIYIQFYSNFHRAKILEFQPTRIVRHIGFPKSLGQIPHKNFDESEDLSSWRNLEGSVDCKPVDHHPSAISPTLGFGTKGIGEIIHEIW